MPVPVRAPASRLGRRATGLTGGLVALVVCSGFTFSGQGGGLRFGPNLVHGAAPSRSSTTTASGAVATAAPATTTTTTAPGPHRAGTTASAPTTTLRSGGGGGGGGGGNGSGSGFVTARGTQLLVRGSQWEFVGYDDYRLTSASPGWQCGGAQSLADIGAALDEIHNNSGATVVRTWFMQAYGGPGNWSQFDRVLSAAAARGMRIIPVLSDQWASCEPWPAGQTRYRTLAWYQSGYRAVDYGYTLSYRSYAAAIAAHYRGNTTIAFWQLVNEAEAMTSWGGTCDDTAANTALRAFADDVAGVIKSNDPNHLVSLGTIGSGQCGAWTDADYENLHAGRIDLCEYHDYYGPGGIPGDQWHGLALRLADCKALNKPIFGGEVGLQASIASDGSNSGPVTASSLQLRASYLQQKLQAQFGAGVVGFLIWQYATGARTDGYEVQPGDPTEGVMAAFAATLPGQRL